MSTRKNTQICLALVFAALLGQQPAAAQQKPSSEVLLPYFEVDLQTTTGVTTMFAIGNAQTTPVKATVTVYTNWGIAISTSTVTLAPNQIRSFDLRPWLAGTLPDRKLSKAEANHFKAVLIGQPSPKDKLYYSTQVSPNLAVGYVRIKAQGDPAPAALWGDYFILNGTKTFGEGDTLINLDQNVGCPGLCNRHALRFLQSGAFDGGTQVVVWSDLAGTPSKTSGGTAVLPASAKAYNEAGQAIGSNQLRLLPMQVVAVSSLGLTQPAGWLDFQTEALSAIAVHHSSKSRFGIALQSYCLPFTITPGAGLKLKKLTNGEDANFPPGPAIPVGDSVQWDYIVTNDGGVRISEIEVEDDQGVNVLCPKDALEPGESMTCTGRGVAQTCQYKNLGTVFGKTPNGLDVEAEDVSHYFGGQNAELDIEKLVNGADADTAPGLEVRLGDTVDWAYFVTNTGDVALNNIKVTDDDKTLTVTCPRGSLRPGETMTCTAQSKAISGAYKNVGTASAATSCGNEVKDTDPAYYTGAPPPDHPGIDIEKLTNGEDADAAPGPRLLVGSPVLWEYIVKNIGDTSLASIKVTDDKGVAVTCPKTTLAIQESMTCTGRGTAREGQYTNLGSVTGTSPKGEVVRDQDPSNYFGGSDPECPAIDIEKHTNGEDADVAKGPELLVGSPVLWEYFVTNTGNTDLSNVRVTDDKGVAVSCPKTSLKIGETIRCTGNGTAIKGQYTNIGSATGASPKGKTVRDSDPSNYFGKDETCDCPEISIKKLTNGDDANVPTGPRIEVGKPVLWEYIVTNTGKSALSNVRVTDDQGVAVSCPKTSLQPDEQMRCTGNGSAKEGQYRNVGTAVGTSPRGQTVRDEDPSHYFGFRNNVAIDIEKHTNGDDADAPTGPRIEVGKPVLWEYFVTNTGDVALSDVRVTDDQGVSVSCPKTSLQPGESMRCTGNGSAKEGQYKNIGKVSGTYQGTTVRDEDPSHYFGYKPEDPKIKIVKTTNDNWCDRAPGRNIKVGSPVTWRYAVTNTGNVRLDSIVVTDDKEGLVSCPKTSLQPGESMTCSRTGVAVACQYSNKGTVTATSPGGQSVTASDMSFYFGESRADIDIDKWTNGVRPHSAPGPEIPVGSPVTWTYVVTNKGDVALSGIKVVDDKEGVVTCPATSLAPGATMTCTLTGTAKEGQYKNTATVTANPPCGSQVRDDDSSYYYGKKPPQPTCDGCSHGFWKNHTSDWGSTGYRTSQKVKDVFSAASGYSEHAWDTLHEALYSNGGSDLNGAAGNLLKQAVAALLNASHPEVTYTRSVASVLSDVNAALASRDRNRILDLAEDLDRDNNLGCPID